MRKIVLLLVVLIQLPACRLVSSQKEDERRELDFVSLAVPAEVGPADAPMLEVSFLLGTDACWDLEGIRVRRDGNVLHVEGSARNPNEGDDCAEVLAYGTRSLPLPLLAAGEYVMRAGELFQNVTVTLTPTGAKDRFVYLGTVQPDDAGCDLAGHSKLSVAFSGLPDSLGSATYLVRGEITGADPCLLADDPSGRPIDYFVTVDEVLPAPVD